MPFYFGGTSLLIVVVVVMDFTAQIQAHLVSHQYESLLKKANLKVAARASCGDSRFRLQSVAGIHAGRIDGRPARRSRAQVGQDHSAHWSSAGGAGRPGSAGRLSHPDPSPEHGHTPHAGSGGFDPGASLATRDPVKIVEFTSPAHRQAANQLENRVMARIAGVNLPVQKHVWVGLAEHFRHRPHPLEEGLRGRGVKPATKINDLTEAEVERLRAEIGKFAVEGDLRREVGIAIKRLMDLACYRGLRHRRGLPLRGQRTRTNARTRKGPRKAIKK